MTKRNPTRQLIKATKSARDADFDYARMRSEIKGVSLGHSGEISTTGARMRREVKKRRKKAHRRMDAPLIREARMNTDTGKWRKVGRYLWVYSVGGYDILVIRPGGIPQGEPGNSVNWDNPHYYMIFIIDPMVGYPTFDIGQETPDPLPKWATHGSDRFAGNRIISSHPMYDGPSIGKVKAKAMDFLRWTMSHPWSPQKKGDGTRRIASLMSEEAWSSSVHDNPAPMVAMAIQQLVMLLVPIILKMGQGKVEKYKRATLQGKIKMLKNWSWALALGVGPGPLLFMKAPGKRAKRMRESLAMGIDNVLKDPQKMEALQAAGEVGVAGVQAYGASKGKIRTRKVRRIRGPVPHPTRKNAQGRFFPHDAVHRMSDDEFDQKYDPVDPPSGESYWEAHEIQGQKKNHVWTVLDLDGDLYIVPGIHRVNQFGFMVTRKPWRNKNIEVKWT